MSKCIPKMSSDIKQLLFDEGFNNIEAIFIKSDSKDSSVNMKNYIYSLNINAIYVLRNMIRQ